MRTAPTPKQREEMARKAEVLFRNHIQSQVAGRPPTDYLLIDVETGDFEVDASELEASERLQQRRPDGLVWMRRVGSPYGRRAGGRIRRAT